MNALPYFGLSENEKAGKTAKKDEKKKSEASDSKTAKMSKTSGAKSVQKGPAGSFYVRELSEPIHNTNRTITVDNWFSSVDLFEKMNVDYKISMIGTLRKNKPEIPPYFLERTQEKSSLFAFDDSKVLVSYAAKKDRNVILLTSIGTSYNNGIDQKTTKPNIILHYNSTKGATDTFDQLCGIYTVARKTLRWTMRIFYCILDRSGVNAMILYTLNIKKEKSDSADTKNMPRRKFLQTLGLTLIEPLLRERLETPTVRTDIKKSIRQILKMEPHPQSTSNRSEEGTGTACAICRRNKVNRKKVGNCRECGQPFCSEHRSMRCTD